MCIRDSEYTLWGEGMRNAMRVRDANEERFHDVYFDDLCERPMDVIRSIYAAAGVHLSTDVETRMHAWLRENPQGKHGEHKYNLDEFGVTEQDIRDHFSDYMDRFGFR